MSILKSVCWFYLDIHFGTYTAIIDQS